MAEVTQGGRSIATIGRGDLVGEMALLQPHGSGRRNATVTAVTDAEIYAGSAERVPPDHRGRPVGGREGARRRSRRGRWSPRPPDAEAGGLAVVRAGIARR